MAKLLGYELADGAVGTVEDDRDPNWVPRQHSSAGALVEVADQREDKRHPLELAIAANEDKLVALDKLKQEAQALKDAEKPKSYSALMRETSTLQVELNALVADTRRRYAEANKTMADLVEQVAAAEDLVTKLRQEGWRQRLALIGLHTELGGLPDGREGIEPMAQRLSFRRSQEPSNNIARHTRRTALGRDL